MEDKCLDCRQALLNQELNKKVEAMETDIKDLKSEVSEIKQNNVGYQKDISNIFKLYEETKKLYEKIDALERKPIKDYEKIKFILITALITAVTSGSAGIVIGKLIK